MIKRVGLTLALAFTPMLASAQPYTEDKNLIDGAKGMPLLCKRVDTATAQTDTDGDGSFCTANQYGAINVNLGSAFQGSTSPIVSEDSSLSEGAAVMVVGARRIDTLSGNPGSNGDAGFINQTGTGALWATLTPSTTGGWSPSKQSALSTTVQTVKASAGNLGGYHCLNAAAAITYIQIFDTSGTVTLGTTTPVLSFGIPASGAGNLEFSNGINFANAIKVAATTTAGGSSAPATAMDCNFFYK